MKAFDAWCNDDNKSVVIGFRAVTHSIVCRVHSTKFCDGVRGAAGRLGGRWWRDGVVSLSQHRSVLAGGVGGGWGVGERERGRGGGEAVRALATHFSVGWVRERELELENFNTQG